MVALACSLAASQLVLFPKKGILHLENKKSIFGQDSWKTTKENRHSVSGASKIGESTKETTRDFARENQLVLESISGINSSDKCVFRNIFGL